MSKKRILMIVICVVLIISGIIGGYVYYQEEKKQELYDSITIEFKDMKILEYGDEIDANDLIASVSGDVVKPEIDTKTLGQQTLIFEVTKEDITRKFEHVIEVKDTKKPIITLTKDKDTLAFEEKFNAKSYIKSMKDPIDGELVYKENPKNDDKGYYTYIDEVNTKKAGNYKVIFTAVDINGNKSEKNLEIKVNEKIVDTPSKPVEKPSSASPSQPNKPISTTKNKVIVIDAGHQGKGMSSKEAIGPGSSTMKAKVSSGTTGVFSKKKESQVNLEVALKLRKELQSRGYSVVMTRTSQNVSLSNQQRAKIGNNANAGAVIHIHCDGGPSSATGAHTIAIAKNNPYCSGLYNASSSLGKSVINAYCQETGIKNKGVSYRNDLTGLNWSRVPSIYIELGFLSNKEEDKKLTDSSFQNKMVKGIANGIDNYF